LQRLAGNQAVTDALVRGTAAALPGLAGHRRPVVQRDAPAAAEAPASTLDSEGNEIGTAAGRSYVVRPGPAGMGFPHAGAPQPAALPANPAATYRALLARCVAAREEQLAYADSLRGDMKYWFAKVYYYVTSNVIRSAETGSFEYPIAVLQETLAFHATYKRNLDAWRAGRATEVESNWKVAFGEAESVNDGSWYRTRAQEILSALLPSMQAHIRFDLPRAIAAVYEGNYAGLPGLTIGAFHPDFDRMAPIFEAATVQIQPEIDAQCWITDFGDWGWLQHIGFPAIFHIGLERAHAFEKAETIVSGHEYRGIHDQARMQERLEAYNAVGHPMRGDDDFAISSSYGDGRLWQQKVGDYDWNAQP
jgi:hypothetical protein